MNTLAADYYKPSKSRYNWDIGVSAFVLWMMVFFRDIGIFPFSPLMILFVVSMVCVFLPYKKLTVFFFYYIPFCFSIHGIVLVPIVLALLLKSRKRNNYQSVFAIIILLFEGLHFVSYEFSVSFVRYLIYIPHIFLFFFILFDDEYDNNSIMYGIKYFVIGTALVLVTIVIHSFVVYGFIDIMMGNIRIGGDDTHFEMEGPVDVTIMNANTLAYFSISAIALILFSKREIFSIVEKILYVLLLLLAGVLTTSRTWLFLISFAIAVYILFGRKKRNLGGDILIVAILALIIMRYSDYAVNVVNRFNDRLENEESMRVAGGRTTLFASYNEFLLEHPIRIIFGTGAIYYKDICKIYDSVHSGLQQIYLSYGLIGLTIYSIASWLFYRRYLKNKKLRIWDYLPFLICFVFNQSIQFLVPHALMFPFLATLLPLKQEKNNSSFTHENYEGEGE